MSSYSCGRKKEVTDREVLGTRFSCECGKVHSTDIIKVEPAKSFTATLRIIKARIIYSLSKLVSCAKKIIKNPFVEVRKTGFQASSGYTNINIVSTNYTTTITVPENRNEPREILRDLSSIAWKNGSISHEGNFFMSSGELKYLTINEAAQKMISHARNVAPGLNVPKYVPIIEYNVTEEGTGGYYRVNQGQKTNDNKIIISNEYQENRSASLSILSHELCHFILNNAGIRKPNTLDNEKLTDVCMFVVGFGKIFLDGFRQVQTDVLAERRNQLGYLHYSDYEQLMFDIIKIKKQGISVSSVSFDELDLDTRITSVFLGDKMRIANVIQSYQRKYGNMSLAEIKKMILDDLYRDRR